MPFPNQFHKSLQPFLRYRHCRPSRKLTIGWVSKIIQPICDRWQWCGWSMRKLLTKYDSGVILLICNKDCTLIGKKNKSTVLIWNPFFKILKAIRPFVICQLKPTINVSCQLDFQRFVSCQLKFWPFVSCQLTLSRHRKKTLSRDNILHKLEWPHGTRLASSCHRRSLASVSPSGGGCCGYT